jgi:hypothetical protein
MLSVQKDQDAYINEMPVSETKFEDTERPLRDGHNDELPRVQNSNEQEQLSTAALHKSEIGNQWWKNFTFENSKKLAPTAS